MKHTFLIFFMALTLGKATQAAVEEAASISEKKEAPLAHCSSFEVYRETVYYLKKQPELPFTEPQILKAALEINKGCDGADRRFKKIFELLVKSGVSIKKCYELAVDFAKMNDQKTDNFAVLFRGLFLENKFDLDFMTAYKVSLELSAGLPKDWEKIQKDFRSFLDYCSSSKSEELPLRICAEWTLSLLKNEDLYSEGVYPSFIKLNDYLLQKKGPQVPVGDRLNLIREIIASGPKAPDNFKNALDWLSSPQGAGLPPQKAHLLALEIARNSMKKTEPLMSAEKINNP